MSNSQIHPTALVDDNATIGADVQIGPYCIIGSDVQLGKGAVLKSHVVIEGRVQIGEGSVIYPFVSLGSPPQDLKYTGEPSELIIGSNNTIREYTTMNPGTKDGGMVTRVGDNCLFMMSTHVAHDCQLGDNIIMANNATLGGHVQVGDFVIIGGLAAVHQFIRIGDHAIIGGMAGVENDVIPYGRVKGERGYLNGLNLIGLERRGFNKDEVRALQRAFNQLFGNEGTLEQRIESVVHDYGDDETVMKIVDFAKAKTRFSLCQPPKKNN